MPCTGSEKAQSASMLSKLKPRVRDLGMLAQLGRVQLAQKGLLGIGLIFTEVWHQQNSPKKKRKIYATIKRPAVPVPPSCPLDPAQGHRRRGLQLPQLEHAASCHRVGKTRRKLHLRRLLKMLAPITAAHFHPCIESFFIGHS